MERLLRAARQATQIGLKNGAENAPAHPAVELHAGRPHHLTARPLQQLHHHVSAQHQQRQHHQGGVVAAVDHAVIHLQHVARRRQHQQAAHQAEPTGTHKKGPQRSDGLAQLGRFLLQIHGASSTTMYSGISPAVLSTSASCAPAAPCCASTSKKASSYTPSRRRDSTISRSFCA